MKKYRLKNLHCANCAANIEETLRDLDSVRFVVLNFATGTLHIDTDDLSTVQEKIRTVDPQVELEEIESSDHDTHEHAHGLDLENKRELFLIGLSAFFFVLGLIFRSTLHHTPFSWAEYVVFLVAYVASGARILWTAARNLRHGQVFDENFLMSIATLGAIAIHELPEAVGVMLFFKVGEFFQDLAVQRSRKSIRALLAIRPEYAYRKVDGEWQKVDPSAVQVGDLILVRPGEKIPLDGVVIEGNSFVDTSPLTGEPVPRSVGPQDEVLAGMINQQGMLTIRVTRPFGESSVSKILDLVENASNKKAETEKFMTKFARYYTPVVVFGALLIAVVPPLVIPGASFYDWIYRALVLLVISCPCALVISIPLGYFGGIGGASRRGILVKGSNFLDVLAQTTTVVFDKTGTLTKGVFRVTKVVPQENIPPDEVLRWAAYAESRSNHPIAQSILEAFHQEFLPEPDAYEEVAGFGVIATIQGKRVVVGNDRMLHRENIPHDQCEVEGTVVHVAVNGTYLGYLLISDELKEDAPKAIQRLRAEGVQRIGMFTGDREAVARALAKQLDLDFYAADLLPEEKVEQLERVLRESDGPVAFVGDGINDAPVIARADVGIAMGALGSDAAIESADVVIMTDFPSKVPEAIRVGKRTRHIVWQNIGMALVVKGAFIALGVVGMATMWEAVFADVGVALLAVFNATRVLRT